MDDAARERLKYAIATSRKSAKQICIAHNWPVTYVSRIVSGEIKKPDANRLYTICGEIGVDIGYILSGKGSPPNGMDHMNSTDSSTDLLINNVVDFVQSGGLSEKNQ